MVIPCCGREEIKEGGGGASGIESRRGRPGGGGAPEIESRRGRPGDGRAEGAAPPRTSEQAEAIAVAAASLPARRACMRAETTRSHMSLREKI